jgi:EAL and modified HD-GYP domain-containing signal transduction protein
VLGRDSERATCSVVLSAFAELGLERVAGKKRIFLPVSYDVISGALPLPIPAATVVLQVRDYEHSMDELPRALAQRRSEGFQVALDGFEHRPESAALLEHCDYVKFNVQRLGVAELARQVALVPARVAAVACKLQGTEEFNAAAAAGCRFFQGPFLFRPQVLSHKRLPQNLKTLVALLRRLRDPSVELAEIDRIVKTEPALGVAVLKFLGSAAYSMAQPVTSVRQAVTLIGLREFSKWVTVVALTATADRPSELSLVALIRARASELVAGATGVDADTAFTVGLISAMGALYERPLDSLLGELPVSADVRAAVLDHAGPLGKILAEVKRRERDDGSLPPNELDTNLVNRAWLEALSWATETQAALR